MVANDNDMLHPAILPHMPSGLRLLADGRRRLTNPQPVTMSEATETAFTLAAIAWSASRKEPA